MNITKTELNALPPLNLSESTHNNNGNIYVVNEQIIYKVFKNPYDFPEERKRNIEFQINHPIPNTPKVYDKLFIDHNFSGYILEFLPHTCTFREATKKKLDLKLKIQAIKDIYEALKYLHQNTIYLGDIHADNFLISSYGRGYLIDLDYMRFPKDEYKFQQSYLVKPNNNAYKINIASKYTDNVKTMIASLSLLLEVDMETCISKEEHSINIEEIYNKWIVPLHNPDLNDYFKRIMNQEETEYFEDSLFFKTLSMSISQNKIL